MSDEVADLLDDAAAWIEKNGWHQGSIYPGTYEPWSPIPKGVPVCAVGAIIAVDQRAPVVQYPTPSRRHAAVRALSEVIEFPHVGDWNDTAGRTRQEVLDAMRLAAKQERT